MDASLLKHFVFYLKDFFSVKKSFVLKDQIQIKLYQISSTNTVYVYRGHVLL